ncbi:hypothetical protein PIB30_016215, partial [Stylosanthes scabra]|nr:hypothetical protein [Stylosanthes scabra]
PPSPSYLIPHHNLLNPKYPQIVHRHPKPPTPPVFPVYHHRPIIPLSVFLTAEHPKPRPPSRSSFSITEYRTVIQSAANTASRNSCSSHGLPRFHVQSPRPAAAFSTSGQRVVRSPSTTDV